MYLLASCRPMFYVRFCWVYLLMFYVLCCQLKLPSALTFYCWSWHFYIVFIFPSDAWIFSINYAILNVWIKLSKNVNVLFSMQDIPSNVEYSGASRATKRTSDAQGFHDRYIVLINNLFCSRVLMLRYCDVEMHIGYSSSPWWWTRAVDVCVQATACGCHWHWWR